MSLGLAPSPMDSAARSITKITEQVLPATNAGICVDSACTVGQASINFYCSPNPLSRIFFATSCGCGIIAIASSGTQLLGDCTGIPTASWVGGLGARCFNRLGKYALRMGNATNGKITDPAQVAELMC